jgi:hypothetical protein
MAHPPWSFTYNGVDQIQIPALGTGGGLIVNPTDVFVVTDASIAAGLIGQGQYTLAP